MPSGELGGGVSPSQGEILLMLREQQRNLEQNITKILEEHAHRIENAMSGILDLGSTQISTCCGRDHEMQQSQATHLETDVYGKELSEKARWSKQSEASVISESRRRFFDQSAGKALRESPSIVSHSPGTGIRPHMPQPTPVHPQFSRIVNAFWFELLSILAVISNAFLLGVQVDWVTSHRDEDLPVIFDVFEIIFSVLFGIELLFRILASGKWFVSCQNHDLNWNMFDSVLVLSSFLGPLLLLFVGSSVNLTSARLLRLMRLVRMLRMVRLFRFFKQLRVVVQTVAASLKPLLWTLILLSVIIFLSAVIILQLLEGEHEADQEKVQRLYGSLLQAQYTLFACLTNGMSWELAAAPLHEITPLFKMFFILYISFSFFCIANIVTGIFVENAKVMNQKDEEILLLEEAGNRETWLKEVKFLFELADDDGSGDLTIEEFEDRLRDMRVQVLLKNLGIDVLSVNPRGLFHSLDFNQSGSITIQEFAEGLLRFHGQARSLDLAEVRHYLLQCMTDMEQCKRLIEEVHLSRNGASHQPQPLRLQSFEQPPKPQALPPKLPHSVSRIVE